MSRLKNYVKVIHPAPQCADERRSHGPEDYLICRDDPADTLRAMRELGYRPGSDGPRVVSWYDYPGLACPSVLSRAQTDAARAIALLRSPPCHDYD